MAAKKATTKEKSPSKLSKAEQEELEEKEALEGDCKQDEDLEAVLTMRQKDFCFAYLFGFTKGKKLIKYNATHAYGQAYGHSFRRGSAKENMCAVEGSRLLRNPKIKQYIKQLIEREGLNDEVVDFELLEIIKGFDPKAKIAAIREYNKLKKRITDKVEHSIDNPLQTLLREISKK